MRILKCCVVLILLGSCSEETVRLQAEDFDLIDSLFSQQTGQLDSIANLQCMEVEDSLFSIMVDSFYHQNASDLRLYYNLGDLKNGAE